MINPKIHIRINLKHLFFLFLLLVGKDSYCQKDSLIKYCDNFKLGMSETLVDSLMAFHIAKTYKAGGDMRYVYDNTNQLKIEYNDKDWNSFNFRMLFRENKLIYIDLHSYKAQKILFSKSDTTETNGLVQRFNKQYSAKDSFISILKSFYTTTYSLENNLDKFFANATTKQKGRLISFAKSLCPEYSASAILRLLELEKTKPFLTKSEMDLLKSFIDSDIEIKFIIGCVLKKRKLNDFINEYRPELKKVIN
jgi:hypothetical protein